MKIENAVDILSSLAQPTRLMVFRLLVMTAEKGLRAGDIAKHLRVPKSALSFHLKELVYSGLIESKREGRSIFYKLQRDNVREVISFLTKDCCQERPELCLPIVSDLYEEQGDTSLVKPLVWEEKKQPQLNILFLCTHNSARSQMAEALLKKVGGNQFNVFSAGFNPRPISKLAIEAMTEIHIDMGNQSSKSTDEFKGEQEINHAIFLCSDPEADCPQIYPFADYSHQWLIQAPNALSDKLGSPIEGYRQTREQIDRYIKTWLGLIDSADVDLAPTAPR